MQRLTFAFLCMFCLLLTFAGSQELTAKEDQKPSPQAFDPSSEERNESLLQEEMKTYLGVPYRRGGTCTKGMDCSGFSMRIYSELFGIKLPHKASQQYSLSLFKSIANQELKTGDLVFFSRKKRVDHVGIYLSDGKFIHSSRKKGVTISSLDAPYYKRTFVGAKRLADMERSLDDVLAETAGMLDVPLTERNHLRFQFAGLAANEDAPYDWDSESLRLHSDLDLLSQWDDRPFTLEVEYHRILLDHAWNVTLSALWEKSYLDGTEGSSTARFASARPSFFESEAYEISRSGMRLASDIDLFRWLRIRPSFTYFEYGDETTERVPFGSVLGLEAHMVSPADRYYLSMAFQYGDSQSDPYSLMGYTERIRSLDMSFAFQYHLTDLLRLSVMGQRSLFQPFQSSRDDSQARYQPYHDLFFTLDFSY